MKLRVITPGLILLLFTSLPLYSQIQKVHFSVKRNFGLPVGKSNESHWGKTKTGYGMGLNLNFFLSNKISLGFDASYLKFSGTKSPDHLRVSKEIFTYSGTFNYYFLNRWIKPFLSAGGGLSNETFVYRIIDKDNFFDQLDHVNVPLISLGTGAYIPFSEHTFFILETKFVSIFSNKSKLVIDRQTETINFNTNYISIFIGLNYEMK